MSVFSIKPDAVRQNLQLFTSAAEKLTNQADEIDQVKSELSPSLAEMAPSLEAISTETRTSSSYLGKLRDILKQIIEWIIGADEESAENQGNPDSIWEPIPEEEQTPEEPEEEPEEEEVPPVVPPVAPEEEPEEETPAENGTIDEATAALLDAYGPLSQEDIDYLLSIAIENPSYEGFVAVAFSVLNRAIRDHCSIKDVVTEIYNGEYQYQGYRPENIGNAAGFPEVARAIDDIANRRVNNPIGSCTNFRGVAKGNPTLWVDHIDQCGEIYCVDGNVFFTDADSYPVTRVHCTLPYDPDAEGVIVFDGETGTWPHGKTYRVH